MTTGPKTTWDELSKLGWSKQKIFDTLNPARGSTMHTLDDLALNEGFAAERSWYSYNILKGGPSTSGTKTERDATSTIVWKYDNSTSLQPYSATVSQSWKTNNLARLSTTTPALIKLASKITIPDVAGSGLKIVIATEAAAPVTLAVSQQFSQDWNITVEAQESVRLEKWETKVTSKASYQQKYGISDDSWIGTKGDKFQEAVYWRYNINQYLDSPGGTIVLDGYSERNEVVFKVIRIKSSGTSQEEIVRPFFALRSDPEHPTPYKVVFAESGGN